MQLRAACAQLGYHLDEATLDQIFAGADRDKSNSLNVHEFLAVLAILHTLKASRGSLLLPSWWPCLAAGCVQSCVVKCLAAAACCACPPAALPCAASSSSCTLLAPTHFTIGTALLFPRSVKVNGEN